MNSKNIIDLRIAFMVLAGSMRFDAVYSATLPVPCVAGSCGSGVSAFVSAGTATAVQAGSKLTVNQATSNATLNWQSFNISKDGTVQFVQPSTTAVALNRIYQANPISIFGSLQANGRVFLINQNGIIFGPTAQVNVGGLLASTLDLNPFAVANGLVSPAQNGQPALQPFANGAASAPVTIEAGASLQTGQGGQVLVFAPTVTNEGNISTPSGQTMLAAGNQIYLASSADPNLRGLLVEVAGVGGTVTNGSSSNSAATSASQLVGQINAGLGNVTLAGLAVNQLGRVSATTSINQNGSIYLQARDHGIVDSNGRAQPGTGGTLTVGAHSDTEVTLDTGDSSKTVDSVAQPKSTITLAGETIDILADSTLRATGGKIEADAKAAQGVAAYTGQADASRIYVADGATLDVSGATVTKSVSSNVIAVQLRGTEFADDPVQRNGPLRGQTVYVDVRQHGTLNGTAWQGTPLANVSGEIAAVSRDVAERNLSGGSIALNSQGDVILAPGSTLDVAGGSINYTAGYVNTSTLLTTAGQAVSITNADPNVTYAGILDPSSSVNSKWGVPQTIPGTVSTYQTGYVEGKDAGSVSLVAPRFVFDGNVNGSTVSGVFQRQPTGSVQLPAGSASLYRSYDEVPQAATLTVGVAGGLGSDAVAGNVTLQAGLELPGLRNADGSAFNPLQMQPLPADYSASVLRPSLFGAGAFGSAAISANGEILETAPAAVRLVPGGSFSAAASVIDLEGSIDAPGGSISATAQLTNTPAAQGVFFTLGPKASLTARGEWVNDSYVALTGAGNLAPLYLSGGTVSLSAIDASLTLAHGSLIDVSGGAQLTTQGSVVGGSGGTIKLSAATSSGNPSPNPDVQLDLGATLLGLGLSKGGTLALTSRGICVAAADCSAGDDTLLWLTPSQLSSGGFGSYKLTAQQGGLTVEPGTQLTLQQINWQLPEAIFSLPDAPTLGGIAATTFLPDLIRQPVNLGLNVLLPANGLDAGGSATLAVTAASPSLDIGRGAIIAGDPGAALSLNSNTRIIVDGVLHAPGGSISLALNADISEVNYEPTQAIWLGSSGVLDAAGIPQFVVRDTGLRTGNVLAGGTVSLTAARGSIELLPGSLIDASGAAAVLDLTPSGGGPSHAQTVASAGGTINLTAAENIVVGGTVRAAAGEAATGNVQPAGGSLLVSMDADQRNDDAVSTNTTNSTFPQNARQVVVSPILSPTVIGEGTPIPDVLAGEALIAADTINRGGFSSVSLQAGYLTTIDAQHDKAYLPGSIAFTGNVTLAASREVSLDAAAFTVSPGTTAHIQAPYVLFGNSDQQFNTVPAATTGTGTLDVSAGFIELYGSSALQGIGTANFASSGDLRLRGLQDLSGAGQSTVISGALSAAGDLNLTATQIYPTTLSQFTLASDPTTGTITIHNAPGTAQEILSAGGVMTLSANTINQDGTLRAPFGEVSLQGNSVQLGAGSLTSTSANGLTVPFGTTQGGFDWVYPLPNFLSIIYGTDGIAPPAQQVRLQGAQINVTKGAVIDVAGGGDLQAYEWINGVGGTQDVLSQVVRPNQYAIVPSLKLSTAPYDPLISQGSALQAGESVYLAGAPGLPAGNYVLLPARYALLPGAFLVTQVSGYQDIQPGQSFVAPTGGTIVAGRLTTAGTAFGDSRTSGFQVVPASVFLQEAQYTTASANQFFAQQAAAAKQPPPSLPRDSGLLSLSATTALSLDGTLLTQPGAGGIGAAVDISSSQIEVTSGAAAASQTGQIVLTAASLDALGAQSLLLGGQRSGDSIATTAQSVVIDGGVTLTAPEVLLAAQDQVSVAAGASITAQGTAATTLGYTLQGDGAFLRVSASPQATVTRTSTSGADGVLSLAQGSTLTANQGSIYLDGSANVLTQGSIAVTGGDLAVQSSVISLGAAPAGTPGTVLGSGILGISGLRDLELVSNSTINFYGGLNLSAQQLTLDSAGLLGFGAASDAVNIAVAKTLTLQNSQSVAQAGTGTGSGTLNFSASDVTVGQGSLGITGFASVALKAQDTLSAESNSVLSTAGDLDLAASRITGAAGSTLQVSASGAVTLGSPATIASPPAVTDLGATLMVSGSSIALNTAIDLPSGRVLLTTTGAVPGDGLTLGSKAVIDVAGLTRTYDGVAVAAPGGLVSLTTEGNLSAAAGSLIDVGAAPNGNGGTLSISASTGTVGLSGSLKGAGAGAFGSAFILDAQNFGDFAALNRSLNTGGFLGERSLRLRGAGDIVVASGTSNAVTAHQVTLEADQGSVIVQGSIVAAGTDGGTVQLSAGTDVNVSGTVDAHATAASGAGGRVELDTEGRLLLGSGSLVNVAGGGAGTSGSVLLRAPRDTVFAVANGGGGVQLNGSISGAAKTTLEAFQVYQNTTGAISAEDVSADPSNPMYQDAATLWSTPGLVAQVTTALGRGASAPTFVLAPGVEIQSAGDLTLSTPWNLYAWRFGPNNDIPGILTLRAAGALTIDSVLSDGFTGPTIFKLAATPSSSWSYRLAAGADLAAANPLSVDAQAPSDFTITAGVAGDGSRGSANAPHMVRTGDGFIDIATSGNFVLENMASLVYTAGVTGPGVPVFGRAASQAIPYPIDGGNISIQADGNIEGAVTNQFVNAWLWRTGGSATISPDTGIGGQAVSWTVNFASFDQGIGALAGGNVSVNAGGDIINLSASIPSIGVQTASKTFPDSTVQVTGGGQLNVNAGGSILGGSFYVGLGNANLRAGVDIGAPPQVDGVNYASPLIGLGDASVSAIAGRNLQISGVVNPSLLTAGASEALNAYFFSTYGSNSRADLVAIGGDLALVNESGLLTTALSPSFLNASLGTDVYRDAPIALDIVTPTFNAYALSGNVNLDRPLILSPAASGNLQVFADKSIIGASPAAQLIVSDADPVLLPNIAAPQFNLQNYDDIAIGLFQSLADQYAATPVHTSDPTGPVRIVARTGDIDLVAQGVGNPAGLWSAKPVSILAGGDIVNLDLVAQNLSPADVSSVVAGGSITYPFARDSTGKLLANGSGITLDGPGELQLQAGGDVNLGTSAGIITRGSLVNTGLPATGAGVSVEAGVPAGGAQYAAFIAKYIVGSSDFDTDLIDFIGATQGKDVDAAVAKQLFSALTPGLQREFIEQEYFSLLRTSGRLAAKAGNGDFSEAFTAIQTLFPGANPNLSKGQKNPFLGDIALYFSQIYTLQGGSVSLLAPGGLINVGLAAAPSSFGVSKTPAQLGLVAQSTGDINAFSYGDFEVNQSRVFAADGGNILVWSTDGDIDAGRGSKTAISAPPPTITINNNGIPVVTFPAALTGSGIQALATTPGVDPGDVDLFAPHGVVNANDAGIVAGNLTIAATAVLGASNITVSGTSVGVPVTVSGLGAGVAGASSTAGSTTGAAADAAQARTAASATPAADSALGWLDVFVTGLGEEQCKPDDIDCIKRQKHN